MSHLKNNILISSNTLFLNKMSSQINLTRGEELIVIIRGLSRINAITIHVISFIICSISLLEVSDCCLTPTQQSCSYIMARTVNSQWDDDDVIFFIFLVLAHWNNSPQIDKQSKKRNTICVRHHYAQTNTNNINKTWAPIQTTGGKDEPNNLFYFVEIVADIKTRNVTTFDRAKW
jgi:hypothetical protein